MSALNEYFDQHLEVAFPVLEAGELRWESLPQSFRDRAPKWSAIAADAVSMAWNALPKELKDEVLTDIQSGLSNLNLAGENIGGGSGGWIMQVVWLAIDLGMKAHALKLQMKGSKVVDSYIARMRGTHDFFKEGLNDKGGVTAVQRLGHYWHYAPNPPHWRKRTVINMPDRGRDGWVWGLQIPDPTGRFPDGKRYWYEGRGPVSGSEKTPQGYVAFSALFWPWWNPGAPMGAIPLMNEEDLREHWPPSIWDPEDDVVNPNPNKILIQKQIRMLTDPRENFAVRMKDVQRVADASTRYFDVSWDLGGVHLFDSDGVEVLRPKAAGEFVWTDGYDHGVEQLVSDGRENTPYAGVWRDQYGAYNPYGNTDLNRWGVKRFMTMPQIECFQSSDDPHPVCSTSGDYSWVNSQGVTFAQVTHAIRTYQGFVASRLSFLEDKREARYMIENNLPVDPDVRAALEEQAKNNTDGSVWAPPPPPARATRPKKGGGGGGAPLVLGGAAIAALLLLKK